MTHEIACLVRTTAYMSLPSLEEMSVIQPKGQPGDALQDRAEQIYLQTQALRTLVDSTYHQPCRVACSITSLVAGLAQVYAGNFSQGGLATIVGLKELYNLTHTGNVSTLEKLLNDIHADVGMIQTLEEGQRTSYDLIATHLESISGRFTEIDSQLGAIQKIATNGLESLAIKKAQAEEKALQAASIYEEALALFRQGRCAYTEAEQTYDRGGEAFQAIQDIVKNAENIPIGETLAQLSQAALTAKAACCLGKEQWALADRSLTSALAKFEEAGRLRESASILHAELSLEAENTLKATREKAHYSLGFKETIIEAKKELQEVQECSDDILILLDEMSKELTRAKEEAQKMIKPSSLFVGIGTSVFLASLGTVAPIVVGVTAAYAWNNGTALSTIKKVYNDCLGKSSTAVLPPVSSDQEVDWQFDSISTGWYGWAKGRLSQTEGTLRVNLGTEVVPLRFNLNDTDYPIAKTDLLALYKRLFTLVREDRLEPARCKEILCKMENLTIPRERFNETISGVIRGGQGAYALVRKLKNLCDKKMR